MEEYLMLKADAKINIAVPKKLKEDFEEFCKEKKTTPSKFLRKLMIDLLDTKK